MELIAITEQGLPAKMIGELPEMATQIVISTAAMYETAGYQAPWIGYLAVEKGGCVGTCAFKAAPRNGEVEIAYFTFPQYEGRGVATRMATLLINIARREIPGLIVTAQTLPMDNASNAILKKLGFVYSGERDHSEDGRVWDWRLIPSGAVEASPELG
ncbi:MAG: GNAT family protein [Acidobacteriota bacterium]